MLKLHTLKMLMLFDEYIFIYFLNQEPLMFQNNKIFSLEYARYLEYAFTYAKTFNFKVYPFCLNVFEIHMFKVV